MYVICCETIQKKKEESYEFYFRDSPEYVHSQ